MDYYGQDEIRTNRIFTCAILYIRKNHRLCEVICFGLSTLIAGGLDYVLIYPGGK